jgi:2-(1,2-epoxy-1,2-dihydrophenyl)acetyl-CoA isomerase
MSDPTVRLDIDDNGVALVTLDAPERRNAMDLAMVHEIVTLMDGLAADDAVGAVVVTGAGKAFCAGQDLAEITGPDSPEVAEIVEKHYNPIVQLIRELEKPVVAAVNGVAAGAGANLALACDIVVAKESASFIQAFSKIGLIPDSGGTYFLPRLIGLQRASALMFTGDKVSAQEAVQMGMIYKAFHDESFDAEVASLVSKLAAMPAKGLAYTKQLLNCTFHHDLTQQLRAEADYQLRAGHTTDYKEGVSAFLEKRKPTFTGQ